MLYRMKRPGEQLKMFMSPGELKRLEPHDAGALNITTDELWDKVSNELVETDRGRDINAGVRRQGVHTPVEIGEEYRNEGTSHLYDGHHRVQAADEAGKQFVPVEYRW